MHRSLRNLFLEGLRIPDIGFPEFRTVLEPFENRSRTVREPFEQTSGAKKKHLAWSDFIVTIGAHQVCIEAFAICFWEAYAFSALDFLKP